MNMLVETYNEVIGYHRWPVAPDEVAFLRESHRHRFEIRCWFRVTDDDREIEIFMRERNIQAYLEERYGKEMQLGHMSCEMLCKELIHQFGCKACQVLEDGRGGAFVHMP
ncbi:MAG: hypothetical protein NC091_13995 [Bacteroides sp.]|nr:hypothetical protein [Bacteroides sp.]